LTGIEKAGSNNRKRDTKDTEEGTKNTKTIILKACRKAGRSGASDPRNPFLLRDLRADLRALRVALFRPLLP